MIWVLAGCFLALLAVPPLLAVVEGAMQRAGPRDVAFWSFAWAVGGTCHVPWGRRGSPVVRFALAEGEGRARSVRVPGRRGWSVEVRAYQKRAFGFAARLCSPPTAPARWRAHGLAPLDFYSVEEEHLARNSLETNHDHLMRWVLRHADTRRVLEELTETTGAVSTEVLLAGSLIIVRGIPPPGMKAGAALEMLAQPLVSALRQLSADLDDLAVALADSGDVVPRDHCGVCGGPPGDDPWHCPACERSLHRGCREMAGGCITVGCLHAADAVPAPGLPMELPVDSVG